MPVWRSDSSAVSAGVCGALLCRVLPPLHRASGQASREQPPSRVGTPKFGAGLSRFDAWFSGSCSNSDQTVVFTNLLAALSAYQTIFSETSGPLRWGQFRVGFGNLVWRNPCPLLTPHQICKEKLHL